MLDQTFRVSPIVLIIFFCFLFHNISAQNSVSAGNPTFEHISVHLDFSGDDNLNSTLQIQNKTTTSTTYLNVAKTVRAHPGLIIDGDPLNMNFHAGSVMHLEYGSAYDIKVILTDPDGGSQTNDYTVSTKSFHEPNMNQVRYVSSGN